MKFRQTSLVINPRAGQNLIKIADIQAVLAAGGLKTRLALKEYGGHTMALATEAVEDGSDLIIAYGGDGTLNQVINGVMHAGKSGRVVGLIPGGTANVWASEIGVPGDPVKAALSLLDSDVRKVDLGHVAVAGLKLPGALAHEVTGSGKHERKQQKKAATRARQHFLLMAGLGIDATILNRVSQPLKYRVGTLAVGASTARELPAHRPFSVEIQTSNADKADLSWQGEALQIVIGNTRLYANVVQMTPDAYIDDGLLDVCVITSGNTLSTMQQIGSLLLRHRPDNQTAEYFQGAHISISVPASIALQLDGSAVKLKKYLNPVDQQALAQVERLEDVMVTYCFDAVPQAVPLAIPRAYDGVLFSNAASSAQAQSAEAASGSETVSGEQQEIPEIEAKSAPEEKPAEDVSQVPELQDLQQIQELLEGGWKVTVRGVSSLAGGKPASVVAGSIIKQLTGEIQPVAVRIDSRTVIQKRTGEHLALKDLSVVSPGHTLIVGGKKSKRGVIVAQRLVI